MCLYKTLFVPDLKENLISIGKATDRGGQVIFKGDQAVVLNKDGHVLLEANRQNGLYIVSKIDQRACLFTSTEKDDLFEKWHNRIRHLNAASRRQLQLENMVIGLPPFKGHILDCIFCIRAKPTRQPFPMKTEKRSTKRLELVHSDI